MFDRSRPHIHIVAGHNLSGFTEMLATLYLVFGVEVYIGPSPFGPYQLAAIITGFDTVSRLYQVATFADLYGSRGCIYYMYAH